MAFELGHSASPARESGGTWFYLADADGAAVAAVLQASSVVPGELLRVGPPGGQPAWELAVESGRRGTVLRISAVRTVPRQAKIDAEAYIRDDLDAWLAALAAIAEDRRPWPGEGMPPALAQSCLASRAAGPMVEASASVDVAAAADRVGQAIASVEVLRAVQTEQVLSCGYISGTPEGEVGGVRYFVHRRGENLLAVASLVAAVSPTGVITRQITTPHGETTLSWAPAAGGARLELTQRFPGSAGAMSDEQKQGFDAAVARNAARFKAAIESWPG
ncbi:MAG TPA: hypothetical protein VME44_17935 [Streptosporangiaceae bacterium]|nr:hypothetical protein [Streptosporangiaceae bacterium]